MKKPSLDKFLLGSEPFGNNWLKSMLNNSSGGDCSTTDFIKKGEELDKIKNSGTYLKSDLKSYSQLLCYLCGDHFWEGEKYQGYRLCNSCKKLMEGK